MVKLKKKKVVIVTGASSGLGRIITKKLSEKNYNLIVCARRFQILNKNFKKNKNVFCYKVDITNEKHIRVFIKKVIKKFGKVDILINNAGVAFNSKFESIKTNDLDLLFKTNLHAPFYLIRECLPIMKKKNYGRIINISSGGSVNCAKNYSAYSASKAGLNTIAKSLNNELNNFNIKVNTLSPGPIKTRMFPKNKLDAELCIPNLETLIESSKKGPSGNFYWFKKKIDIIPKLKINWAKPSLK